MEAAVSQRQVKAARRSANGNIPQQKDEPKALEEPQNGAAGEESADADETPSPPAGVIVMRVKQADGSEKVNIQPINGMDPLAIPTLLKFAIKIHNQSLGLEE